ncbi:MAG: DUF4383 domain-containing protein [Solirubrobacterales bacterium]
MDDQHPTTRRSGPGPARLFAAATGIVLAALGIVELLVGGDPSAGLGDGPPAQVLVGLEVNGRLGLVHLSLGVAGVVGAATVPRLYALLAGATLLGLGLVGLATDTDGLILDSLPVSGVATALHLLLGVAGLAAGSVPASAEWEAETITDDASDSASAASGGGGLRGRFRRPAAAASAPPTDRPAVAPEAKVDEGESEFRADRRAKRPADPRVGATVDGQREGGRRKRAPRSRRADKAPSPPASRRAATTDANAIEFRELRALQLTMNQAARFIETRDKLGGFSSIEDIERIPGLPSAVRAELTDRLHV